MPFQGIEDYLEIMQLAGVSELRKPVNTGGLPPPALAPVVEPKPVIVTKTKPEVMATPVVPPKPVVTIPIIPSSAGLSKAEQLEQLAEAISQCSLCPDLASSRTQTVFGTGNPDADLVFLGEAPGADEDKQGEPFVGRAGQLLNDIISKGMKLRRDDVYICNILRCRPPGNRNPMPDEAAHCRPILDRTLEIIQPKFICCLGAVAARNLLSSELTIGALRKKVSDYKGIKVICTYHPAYLLRNPSAKKDTWDDIQLLMQEMGNP